MYTVTWLIGVDGYTVFFNRKAKHNLGQNY
jgi:hypothetical protein